MKKLFEALFFLLPVVVIAALIYFGLRASPDQQEPLKNQPTPLPTIAKVNNQQFSYYSYKLVSLNQLKLIDNLGLEDSQTIYNENNCLVLINGGFYGKDQQPLGLVVIDSQVLFPQIESELFNGFFWLSSLGGFGITSTPPEQELQLALQSGPMLMENGQKQLLQIQNDKQARRSVVASLNNGSLWLLIVFDSNSVFLGPRLAELPEVIENIASKEDLVVIDALNLDGGTASMFKNNQVFLSEYKPVRTFLCVTKE